MNLARYRQFLAGLRTAHGAVEPEIGRHAEVLRHFGYDAADRSKLSWLDDDLAVLGAHSLYEGAYRYEAGSGVVFRLHEPASAFGAIYVMEGATLGGQVVARHVIPALGLTATAGCRYFAGYGGRTGERWRDTANAIARYSAAADAADRIVQGAQDTFAQVEASLLATCR